MTNEELLKDLSKPRASVAQSGNRCADCGFAHSGDKHVVAVFEHGAGINGQMLAPGKKYLLSADLDILSAAQWFKPVELPKKA